MTYTDQLHAAVFLKEAARGDQVLRMMRHLNSGLPGTPKGNWLSNLLKMSPQHKGNRIMQQGMKDVRMGGFQDEMDTLYKPLLSGAKQPKLDYAARSMANQIKPKSTPVPNREYNINNPYQDLISNMFGQGRANLSS